MKDETELKESCDPCAKAERDFRLQQFKILAAIAILILLFIADPGSYGH